MEIVAEDLTLNLGFWPKIGIRDMGLKGLARRSD